jgi:hypothetical protein
MWELNVKIVGKLLESVRSIAFPFSEILPRIMSLEATNHSTTGQGDKANKMDFIPLDTG